MTKSIALLTDRRYEASEAAADDWYLNNILNDDRLLIAALRELGINATRLDWSRPNVDWSRFDAVVFRTTWDYFDRFDEFSQWLDQVAQQTRLLNDVSVIRWNMDKHYLADLASIGVRVVPTRFLERLGSTQIEPQGFTGLCESPPRTTDWLRELDVEEAVIKPCVSGAARHTYRVNKTNAADIDAIIQSLLEQEAFLIQPFQHDVMRSGETSLMVIGSQVTHAIRKTPKTGDFRVQDDHGGTVHDHQPTAEEIQFAEHALKALSALQGKSLNSLPIYGRVDLVRDNFGALAVMELELIEPELWLRCHPPAATVFAKAIRDQL